MVPVLYSPHASLNFDYSRRISLLLMQKRKMASFLFTNSGFTCFSDQRHQLISKEGTDLQLCVNVRDNATALSQFYLLSYNNNYNTVLYIVKVTVHELMCILFKFGLGCKTKTKRNKDFKLGKEIDYY